MILENRFLMFSYRVSWILKELSLKIEILLLYRQLFNSRRKNLLFEIEGKMFFNKNNNRNVGNVFKNGNNVSIVLRMNTRLISAIKRKIRKIESLILKMKQETWVDLRSPSWGRWFISGIKYHATTIVLDINHIKC